MEIRPVVAVSSCMVGNSVRHNGGHTHDRWLTEVLVKYVDLVVVCPEMEMGMGVPREEVHLVYPTRFSKDIRMYKKVSKIDITDLANDTYERINGELRGKKIDGHILMRKSPSCGLDNVKTVSLSGEGPVRLLTGLYAMNISNQFPNIPLEQSGRIRNLILREHFVKCVFAHHRLMKIEKSIAGLQDFHRKSKYMLMEHNQNQLRKLGAISGNSEKRDFSKVYNDYITLFMETIRTPATVENRCNTLMHLMGYLKKELTKDDKQELLQAIHDYSEENDRYMTPVSIIHFFVKKFNLEYLEEQYIFSPYPKEMTLHKEL